MAWWIPALAAVGALQGGQQASAQRKAQAAQNKAAAAQTEFSPWTHMGAGQTSNAPTQSDFGGALLGGIEGGLTGAAFGQQFGEKKPTTPTPEIPTDTTQPYELTAGGFDRLKLDEARTGAPVLPSLSVWPKMGQQVQTNYGLRRLPGM